MISGFRQDHVRRRASSLALEALLLFLPTVMALAAPVGVAASTDLADDPPMAIWAAVMDHVRRDRSVSLHPSVDLAMQLFEEGDWTGCRIECTRLLAGNAADATPGLIKALADRRAGLDGIPGLIRLCRDAGAPTELRALARYEIGRALWQAGDATAAFEHMREAFEQAVTRPLFLHAGCSLYTMMLSHPDLSPPHSSLRGQLRSCYSLWSSSVWRACEPPVKHPAARLTGQPGQWVVSLYQRQISPAIGQRCSLSPSCSNYARQALRKHGLLGFALSADRAVREPSLVAAGRNAVQVSNRWYYADPLEEHDAWMEE